MNSKQKPGKIHELNSRIGCAFLIAGAVGLAWINRFVQDDAFISFRYARNLAEGRGLVWNIGECVEGYTNFLWTVCLVPAFWFNIDIVLYSYMLSLLAFTVTLGCAWRLAEMIWDDQKAGFLAVALLGVNYSFSSYATGGLETQFVTAWTMTAIVLIARWRQNERFWWLVGASLASAGAVMTRMDASLLLLPFWAWVLTGVWRNGGRGWKDVLVAGGVGMVPVVSWLLWRHAYYGFWVPNTSLIKLMGPTWVRGLVYVGLFYVLYGYAVGGLLCLKKIRRVIHAPLVVSLLGAVVSWHGYLVLIGGDFMEFRMIVPSLPLVIALLAGGILAMRSVWRLVVVTGLAGCSMAQSILKPDYPCTEPKRVLQDHVTEWREIAEILNTAFEGDKSSVKIGVTCAGVIPFYTEMPALDLFGLTDRDVAVCGNRIVALVPMLGNRPGHVRAATGDQVLAKGVHLLLNNPWVVADAELGQLTGDLVRRRWRVGENGNTRRITLEMVVWAEPAEPFPVVAWPCGGGRNLITIYVRQSDQVDAAIKRSGAKVLL